MVSFQNAVGLGFQHYFDFKGRSTRSEYWWWLLFVVLAGIALTIVDMGIGTFNYESGDGLLSGLFKLATLIPGLALGARRLHDINKSAWWLLMWLSFLLIIPVIVLLVWAARQGDNGTNRYGPDPRGQP
ncbi:MAG TPA: DUF805 domain-containing protein [Dehalococcoidia bacterium]|jgi:uncharacterized membrane protein YhaH (DUF805 family)|nr:DUF805 domain-containing protein [Dehalococcoidia bacterium]